MKRFLVMLCSFAMLFSMKLPVSAESLSTTLIRSSAADPWICYHDGYYYLTVTGSKRIAVFKSKTLAGFSKQTLESNIVYDSASDKTVKEVFGAGATLSGTWSPELHYFTEEEVPGNSGWYMFLALRKATGDSSEIQLVVLKSLSGAPNGPYGHPLTGERNHSQPFSNADGSRYTDWAAGQSVLKISEGQYKGIYTTWVTEVGRGGRGDLGQFYQKLMIAKMKNPWTIESEPGVITTPTQIWEYSGASKTHPRVVEGATALYGTRGDVYITYSGSGYWSDYGLGQLTWNGGDPLLTSSWVKLSDKATENNTNFNPIFQAKNAENLRGCGHASFIRDKDGKGFLVYHAYPYENAQKANGRNAYIEPYYIDYTQHNGVSWGVIHMGLDDNRAPANTNSKIEFENKGDYLEAPDVIASGSKGVTLSMYSKDATGYTIYRSTDGEEFSYLASVDGTLYNDSTAEDGNTYYYRVYAYRNQELSDRSEVASAKASSQDIPPETVEIPVETTPGAEETTSSEETDASDVQAAPTEPDKGNKKIILPIAIAAGIVAGVVAVAFVIVSKKKKE